MSISEEAFRAGAALSLADGGEIPDALNAALNLFVGDHFRSATGSVIDRDGGRSERFAAVVYEVGKETVGGADPFLTDTVAAVIDGCEELTPESLRVCYRRIANAKALKKTEPLGTTLGIVFALRSAVPLAVLAEELERLNTTTPAKYWPDFISIASVGAINYGVQFPTESVSGDFVLPPKPVPLPHIPPFYVVIISRPTGAHTFNKTLAFLIAHLSLVFAPAAKLPNWKEILEGVSQTAMTHAGYQYNLSGELMPVPRNLYNDRYIPPRPLLIEDKRGRVLSTIRFQDWQDGGVILLMGLLPLDGILVFLGKKGMQSVVRLANAQLSHVLPITKDDFTAMLNTFQQRSNLRVKADPGRFVVEKFAEEGSASPFMARIVLGIMRLRDAALADGSKREEFDKLFEFLMSSLLSVRTSSRAISEMWEGHAKKISSGEIVNLQGDRVHIQENINRDLRREVESFLNTSVRTMKTGLQNLGKSLNVDIGFLFKQQTAFESGVAELEKGDPALATYLRHTRIWSEPVLKSRIDLEHSTWVLPKVVYTPTRMGVSVGEPEVAGRPVSEFVRDAFDRLTCFVEEFTAHCLQQRMLAGITIAEIPLAQRPPEAPERFKLTLVFGGVTPWRIAFHASTFEET